MRQSAEERFKTKANFTRIIKEKNEYISRLESITRKQDSITEVYKSILEKLAVNVGLDHENLNALEVAIELDKMLMTTPFYKVD